MGLSLALNTARSSLLASSSQMAVVSRNNAGATDPYYSRKIASLVTGNGSARVVVNRATDTALFYKMLGTTSTAAGQQAVLKGLQKLQETIGDTKLNQSAAARIGALNASLQLYAKEPDDPVLAQAVVTDANKLATMLNDGAATVQQVREDSDAAIAKSVEHINDLLSQFESVNRTIVKGTASGADISDDLDTRDRILAQLSEEIGITAVTREGNDMAVYTDSGVPLFEKTARAVTFTPTSTYSAGTVGAAVFIDGVQVTGSGPMPLHSGALVGHVKIRDEVAVSYQKQLDEIARGLIEAFAESDQVPPATLPNAAGLFTYSGLGAPGMPAGADLVGLAGNITVNAAIDPAKGGNLDLLRDGGVNGADYRYNPGAPGSNAAFSERLYGLIDELAAERPFDPSLGLGASGSLQGFSAASASWLEAGRKAASTDLDYQTTLLQHASEALSNATGVNTDDETALMLQIEKSYAASAKLLSVIDEMLNTLLNSVR